MNAPHPQPSLLNRVARVLLCLVFLHAVFGKITGFAGVAGAIAAKGLPLAPVLLVAAMALMAVGSALVISGWKARMGAVLLLPGCWSNRVCCMPGDTRYGRQSSSASASLLRVCHCRRQPAAQLRL